MMAERSQWIFRCGSPMRIRRRTHRRIAYWSSVERYRRVFVDVVVINGGQFHEEIVWVLGINNRLAISGLALLKEFWIASIRNSYRFETQHASQREHTVAYGSLRHRHKPIGGEKLVPAARPGLLQFVDECFSVEHQHPATTLMDEHFLGRGDWLDVGSRRGVLLQCFNHRTSLQSRVVVIHAAHTRHGHLVTCFLCHRRAAKSYRHKQI